MSESENSYRIFVNDTEIYSGDFREVPDKFRQDLTEALDEWGDVLGKSNLNEMIYSLLAWYEEREYICNDCGKEHYGQEVLCDYCGAGVNSRYRYERDKRLTRIMLCIGMITHIEINEK